VCLCCRGCLGPRALVFGRVEDFKDRLAGGEDTACGQRHPATGEDKARAYDVYGYAFMATRPPG